MTNEKIQKYLKPCTIVFFKGRGFISKAIIEAQHIYVKERFKKSSQWSHIGFVGIDGKFYESTVKVSIKWQKKILFKIFGKEVSIKVPKINYVYGIYITDVEKRFKNIEKTDEKLGFQYDIQDLTLKDWEEITNYGKFLKEKNIKYGGKELFGTLITLIKWKITKNEKKRKQLLKEKNPFDTSDVYCVAFVSDCIKEGSKRNYTDPSINHSVLTVDEPWHNPLFKLKKKAVRL